MKNLFRVFVVLACFMSVFYSCQEEDTDVSSDSSNYLDISGDVTLASTLMNPVNNVIYGKAVARFYEHVYIDNGKYAWNLERGTDINVSEDIYQYIIFSLTKANQLIEQQKAIVFIDENGKIQFSRLNYDKIYGAVRMTQKDFNEDWDGPKDISQMNSQEILDLIVSMTQNFGEVQGRMEDYFDMSSINWKTNSAGDASISGHGTINGKETTWYMANPAYYLEDQSNTDFNNFAIDDVEDYSDRTIYFIRNPSGLPLMSYQISK